METTTITATADGVAVSNVNTSADKRYASRKWLFSIAVWIVGSLVWVFMPHIKDNPLPLMTTEQWIDFSKWVLGIYMIGNVGDSAADKMYAVLLSRFAMK